MAGDGTIRRGWSGLCADCVKAFGCCAQGQFFPVLSLLVPQLEAQARPTAGGEQCLGCCPLYKASSLVSTQKGMA